MLMNVYFPFDKVANAPSAAYGPILALTDGQCVRDNTARLLQFKVVPFDGDLCYKCVAALDTETMEFYPRKELVQDKDTGKYFLQDMAVWPRNVELSAYKFPEAPVEKEKPNQAQVDEMARIGHDR